MSNVGTATGRTFASLFHEWANMLLLDGSAIPGNDPIFELESIDLRADFEAAKAILESNPAVLATIDAAHALADRLRVSGTPTFVINDKFSVGQLTGDQLERLIEEARS